MIPGEFTFWLHGNGVSDIDSCKYAAYQKSITRCLKTRG